jgi:hypothetical protein
MQLFVSSQARRDAALEKIGKSPSVIGGPTIPGAPSYGSFQSGVLVNPGEIQAVIQASKSGYHFNVVDTIISGVVDCGFSIHISYKKETVRLSNSDEYIIQMRWADLAREALRMILTVGFVVISVGEEGSTDYEPAIIPFELIRVKFVHSALHPKKAYWVEDCSTGQVLDCMLWIDRAPDSYGSLTSCGASLLDEQIIIEHTAGDQLSANYVRSHPVYAFEHTVSGIARQDVSHTDQALPGEVDREHSRVFHHILEREESATESAMRKAHNAINAVMSQAVGDQTLPPLPSAVRRNTQFLKPLMVPPNMHLVAAPTPQLNPEYKFEIERYAACVRGAYKVTQETMDPQHSQKLAASSDKNEKRWNQRIGTLQAMLKPMIADCFRRVNKISIEKFSVGQSEKAIAERVLLVDKITKEEQEKTRRAIEEIRDRPNPANWTPADPLPDPPASRAEEERRNRKRSLAESRKFLRPTTADTTEQSDDYEPEQDDDSAENASSAEEITKIITNDAGEKQLEETAESLRRLVHTMMDAGDENPAEIINRMELVVEFNNLPNVTLEQLKVFKDDAIIGVFEYARQASKITGLAEECFITSPEQAMENALQVRENSEFSAPRPPPEEDTTPAGSRAKSSRR